MSIEYNPNKKSAVNGYIDKVVFNLKGANKKTDSVLRSKPFPSKTIIGKKFKKEPISNLEDKIAKAYGNILSVKGDIQEQIDKYLKTKNIALEAMSVLGDSLGVGLSSLFNNTKMESLGYSYNDIQEMHDFYRTYRYSDDKPNQQKKAWEYYDLYNEALTYSSGVLHSNVVKKTILIDENCYESTDKTESTSIHYACLENKFADFSQCQGAAWIGNNRMAVCEVNDANGEGIIRLIEINPDNFFDIKTMKEIPIEGKPKDIECITDENIILLPNYRTKEIEVIYLNNELQEKKREKIKNVLGNSISYDKKNDEIIVLDDINGKVYLKEDFLRGKEPKKQFMIPDKIKDEENGMYYYLKGRNTAKNGKIYVSYSGYDKDQRRDYEDMPQESMIAVYDSETGECINRYIINCNGEIEKFILDEEGNIIFIINYENNTYVIESKLYEIVDATKRKSDKVIEDVEINPVKIQGKSFSKWDNFVKRKD